jgi:hypothetical protein
MPAARTITDTKGRALKGTILATTDIAITFQREGDPASKKFEIKLDTLSQGDRVFVGNLVTKKYRVLVVENSRVALDALRSYPLDLVIVPQTETPGFAGKSCDISAITPEELAKYHIIWGSSVKLAQRKQWRELLKNYTGVVCDNFPAVTTRNQWLEDRNPTVLKDKPFVKEDRNFVFYNPHTISKEGRISEVDPAIYKQVIDLAIEMQN